MAAAAAGRGGALQPGPQGGGPDERLARAGPGHSGRGGSPDRRTAEDDGQRPAPGADPRPDGWSRAAPGGAHRADPPRVRLRQRGDRPAVWRRRGAQHVEREGEKVNRLAGKVALISGGARGQGASHGRIFAQEGARVVLGDVRDELGESTASQLRDEGLDVRYVHLDVASATQWAA